MLKIYKSSKILNLYRNAFKNPHPKPCKRMFCSENQIATDSKKNFVNFNELVAGRQDEARKSILVQVNSAKSFNELVKYCNQFGKITSAHHYSILEDDSHFILLEYSTPEESNAALDASVFNQETRGIPARSSFLWFRTGPKAKLTEGTCRLNVVNGHLAPHEDELNTWLKAAENTNDQIHILHKATSLTDLGVRLRFLAAEQLQNSISGMFPTAYAHPFGSSVNGFGKQGCDLDLVLRLEAEDCDQRDSRLVFHTKANLNNSRTRAQRYMENISDVLQLFLPGVNNVRRILQARVPIVKYNHEYLDLEVDLSMNNLTGVYMSELLYMFGEIDSRVRPLTFSIRRWAKCVGLTNPTPGRWISNFSLTMLVLHYLQSLKVPMLPAINLFIQKARDTDKRITEDNINCSFLRDLNALNFHTQNQDTIENLLHGFFEFYSQFDFSHRGISLNEAKSIPKPDHSAMYIVNPLEPHLNVSKNVSLEETERFKVEIRNAAWILESEMERTDHTENWGLMNLFKMDGGVRPQMFFKSRMVEVTDLFDENDVPPPPRVDYKNDKVRKQVEDIHSTTRKELHKLKVKPRR